MLPPDTTTTSTAAPDHEDHGHPGVEIERRAVLCLPAFAAAGVLVLQNQGQGIHDVSFDAFLAKLIPQAEKLVAEKAPNEESYLHEVAAWLARTSKDPAAEMKPCRSLEDVSTGSVYREIPISVLRFRVAPNGVIPLHNHTATTASCSESAVSSGSGVLTR